MGCKGLCAPALRGHPSPHPQLVLYCHLHGSATNSLSISYVIKSTKHLMRERTGDLGSFWVRERVEFNVTDPFKVGWCCAGGHWVPGVTPEPTLGTPGSHSIAPAPTESRLGTMPVHERRWLAHPMAPWCHPAPPAFCRSPW